MNKTIQTFLIVILTLNIFPVNAQMLDRSGLKSGDLLFQDLDCGPMCEAIEAVTVGWNKMSFSHVGIVAEESGRLYVWESVSPGVRRIAIDSFKGRSENPLLVGRLKSSYQSLIPAAIDFLKLQEGVRYDDEFLYGNEKYYCSELIYDAFKAANQGRPFFKLFPMTFRKPGSKFYFPVWVQYFEKIGMSIPEGKPGCNPGGLSRSRKINILGQL